MPSWLIGDKSKRAEIRRILLNRVRNNVKTEAQMDILENIRDLCRVDAVNEALSQCRGLEAHLYNGKPLPRLAYVPPPRATECCDDPLVAIYMIGRLLDI